MNILSIFHLIAVSFDVGLGISVYKTNPRRPTNQLFLILSGILACWLIALALAFSAPSDRITLFLIRFCHSMAALFPLTFDWLRQSILFPADSSWKIITRNRVWLGAAIALSLTASLTPLIVQGMYSPSNPANPAMAVPEPVFGVAFWLFPVFFTGSLILLIWEFARSLKHLQGIRRAEMNYVLLGAALGLLSALGLVILVPLFMETSAPIQLAPLSVIVLDVVIAYGITTRRIMDMAYVFRMAIAYSLLIFYLSIVYFVTWWPVNQLLSVFHISNHPIAHFLAALTTAFSLAPAHGRMQRFANRVFIHFAPMDVSSAMQSTSNILRSITTIDALVSEFARLVAEATGTDQVRILFAKDDSYVERYPLTPGSTPLTISQHDILPQMLRESGETIVPDIIKRLNPNPTMAQTIQFLDNIKISAAAGMRSPDGLEGILLLGPKLSGRIYGAPDQQGLQLLCNQLAIALNNARLYTEVQNAKLYNDLLVDGLASGVIAADTNSNLTVFNREAQRILHLASAPTTLAAIPPALADVFTETITQGQGTRDKDIILPWPDDTETPVRVSSSVFYSHTGQMMGAFLVINDLTTIRHLELQVRRTDRLASIGTLAAGMAHEIKNPLVSIKTFTQLLPERFDDADFRDTFTSLVGSEVKRIDTIVNQLLRFSRPSPPTLTPSHLHEILDHATKLMSQQLRQKNIRLEQHFAAASDLINADAQQLGQALINFFLNAIDAMPDSGTLTITTTTDNHPLSPPNHHPNGRHIVLSIQDTGEGIAPDALTHIFDPFFTTKSHGTGLGLSVAHGIIHEHSGIIDVKSAIGQGTTFTLQFPLFNDGTAPT
jgi:signal transduction histidine kinase